MNFKYFGMYGELYIDFQEINKAISKFWMNLMTSLISTYNYNVTSSFFRTNTQTLTCNTQTLICKHDSYK